MSKKMTTVDVLHNLPLNSVRDERLLSRTRELCVWGDLQTQQTLAIFLEEHSCLASFDLVLRHVVCSLKSFLDQQGCMLGMEIASSIAQIVGDFFPAQEIVSVYRTLAHHASSHVRRKIHRILSHTCPDVVLPEARAYEGWGWHGLSLYKPSNSLTKSPRDNVRVYPGQSLPRFYSCGALRRFLGVETLEEFERLLTSTAGKDGTYTTFTIPKRNGQQRTICAPKERLKKVQQTIHRTILRPLAVHDAAHGFRQGRSIVTNAKPHVRRALIVKFDLRDFFPSIHFNRVRGFLRALRYPTGRGFFSHDDASREVAGTLARLMTFNPHPNGHYLCMGYAPQGAPTSPALANLLCWTLDARLTGLAASLSGQYTRYADDLTFSFDKEPSRGLGRFRWWVENICHQEGFQTNASKYRVLRRNKRQNVTGIVVNDTMRVSRKERRRVRAILHNCRRFGVSSQSKGDPNFLRSLEGYIHYIHMVHPPEGVRLKRELSELRGGQF